MPLPLKHLIYRHLTDDSGWGIRWPLYLSPGAGRKALTLLLMYDVPPDAILRIFRAFGVEFDDDTVFADRVESYRADWFRILGMAVCFAAFATLLGFAMEFVFSGAGLRPVLALF